MQNNMRNLLRVTLVEKALDGHRGLNLPASCTQGRCSCVRSCLQTNDLRRVGNAGRVIPTLHLKMINALVFGFSTDGNNILVECQLEDSLGVNSGFVQAPIAGSSTSTAAILTSEVVAAINAMCDTDEITRPDTFTYVFSTPDAVAAEIAAAIPPAPSSYQTIVSQTGTSAPTTAGVVNTYAGAPTFTWARTAPGVYTLTASAAVFTAGKTGIVLGSLNNLNASYKTVVSSSTVLTITTAIGSLLGLGLLGLTATNTDALLTATQVTVQTYA